MAHARFVFFHPKDIDDELIINARNKTTNTYNIVYKQPSNDNVIRTWNCPADYLDTYINRFFEFMYMDSKKPGWMQIDADMYPSVHIKFNDNKTEVDRAVSYAIEIMKMV